MSKGKVIVQKYGGTSLGSPARIKAVAERIKGYRDRGFQVVVVVSAMGKETDRLVELAGEVTQSPRKREMDVLLSTGEQVSISLLAMALHEIGLEALSYTGAQAGVKTDGNFSNAKIIDIKTDRIVNALENDQVVIVAGFQGTDDDENITTLGRGGSDTSAVALAAALQCNECEIYTDVEGVFTADPRIVPQAKKLNEISYDEMLELARLGAGVLHSRSVELAKKFGVKLHVRSSFSNSEGTILMSKEDMVERYVVSGITTKNDEAKFTLRDIPDSPGISAELFTELGNAKVYVNMIVQSTGHDNQASISFTVKKNDIAKTIEICEKLQKNLGASSLEYDEGITILSAVGVGMISAYGVAGRMFQILSGHNINIEMISTSEIGISCVIDSIYAELAAKVLHKEFIGEV